MTPRDEILEKIKRNQPSTVLNPEVPDFARVDAKEWVHVFKESLTKMAGEWVEAFPKDFQALIKERYPEAQNICSVVPEFTGNRRPSDYTDWSDPMDLDLVIVRAPLGVAETGSVLLSETELQVNTIAFLAEHIIVLLDPTCIVENVHAAYKHSAFNEKKYVVLVTGPSGTADIEGTVVHPAQGVKSLTVIPCPQSNGRC
jgi:L-lactate dehydrogenase complex protein LldG